VVNNCRRILHIFDTNKRIKKGHKIIVIFSQYNVKKKNTKYYPVVYFRYKERQNIISKFDSSHTIFSLIRRAITKQITNFESIYPKNSNIVKLIHAAEAKKYNVYCQVINNKNEIKYIIFNEKGNEKQLIFVPIIVPFKSIQGIKIMKLIDAQKNLLKSIGNYKIVMKFAKDILEMNMKKSLVYAGNTVGIRDNNYALFFEETKYKIDNAEEIPFSPYPIIFTTRNLKDQNFDSKWEYEIEMYHLLRLELINQIKKERSNLDDFMRKNIYNVSSRRTINIKMAEYYNSLNINKEYMNEFMTYDKDILYHIWSTQDEIKNSNIYDNFSFFFNKISIFKIINSIGDIQSLRNIVNNLLKNVTHFTEKTSQEINKNINEPKICSISTECENISSTILNQCSLINKVCKTNVSKSLYETCIDQIVDEIKNSPRKRKELFYGDYFHVRNNLLFEKNMSDYLIS
jgi:hypothetical protein